LEQKFTVARFDCIYGLHDGNKCIQNRGKYQSSLIVLLTPSLYHYNDNNIIIKIQSNAENANHYQH